MSSVPRNLKADSHPVVRSGVSTVSKPRRTSSPRRSFSQLLHVAEGGLESGFGTIPDLHPVHQAIGLHSRGLLVVGDAGGDKVEIQLGVDLAVDMKIALGDGEFGRLVISGKRRFEFFGAEGVRGTFQYFPHTDSYGIHSLREDITKTKLGGSVVIFAADGSAVIDGTIRESAGNWTEQLRDGTHLVCLSGHLSHQVEGAICEDFTFDGRRNRWFKKYNSENNWSFGEVLNGESSTSVELLGLITVYANGTIELWKTHSYAPGSEIDQALVDDDGRCVLYVRRDFGSSDVYLHEDNAERATGVARYIAEYFPGKKDPEVLYPAWLYTASDSSLPVGIAPTSWLGTLVAVLFFLLAVAGVFASSAVAVLLVSICGVAVYSAVRPFVYSVRAALGV